MAYVSVAETKLMLGIAAADTSEDSLLTALISEAQSAIDARCGRSFEAAAMTKYYNEIEIDGQTLMLHADLISVTTLTNGDGTIIPAAGYFLWPRNGGPPYWAIKIKSTYSWSFVQDGEIMVLGSWGYSAIAPAVVQRATKEYVHFLYHDPDALREHKQGAQKAGVLPEHISASLASLRRRSL